ncbi:unnamed protein product [Closterium sp. NIES-53]
MSSGTETSAAAAEAKEEERGEGEHPSKKGERGVPRAAPTRSRSHRPHHLFRRHHHLLRRHHHLHRHPRHHPRHHLLHLRHLHHRRVVEVAAGVVVRAAVEVVEAVEVEAVVEVVAGVGALAAAVEASVGVAVVAAVGLMAVGLELLSVEVKAVAKGSRSSVGARPSRHSSFVSGFLSVGRLGVVVAAHMSLARVAIFDLDFDAILAAMYALFVCAEGDCYLCVPPDPGIEGAALGASEFALPGTAPAEALHTFTLDSGASRCFFRDSTTLTPLSIPMPVRMADPFGGLVVARSSTVLPCPAVLSGSLLGLHLPSFSTNLVRTAALQDAMVTTTIPGGQRVSICTCTWTGPHLATFTRQPGSSLYTLATETPQVAASVQVSASGQVAPPCSCRLLSHQTLLWHHRLGHPSLPRLRDMHSRLLVSGLPRPCLPSRPRLLRHAFLASRGGSVPLLTPPRFPRRLLPCRLVVPKYYSGTVIALPFNLQACSASGILWGGA